MYGMKYSTTGSSTDDAPNNGAFYIIKQADNSVILIDGGGSKQATTAAKEGLWNFLKEITGKGESEKITVACWFVTHAHEDHYKLAYDLLRDYRANIDLQRVMFNFPTSKLGTANSDLQLYDFRSNIQVYYPNVKYLKCHTGQSIQLGGLVVDILMTHEDMVDATTGVTTMESGNSMTTLARFTLPDGTVFLSLGDFEEVQQDVLFGSVNGYLNSSELECDIITVAHHGFNEVEATYKAAKATYALWSNSPSTNFPRYGSNKWRYERAQDIIGWLKSANSASQNHIYYAGQNTVKLTCANGNVTVSTSEVIY